MTQHAKKPKKPTKSEMDRDLDAALEQTFPASDPLAVGQPTGAKPPPAPGEPLRQKRHGEPAVHEEDHRKAQKQAERQTTVDEGEKSIVPGPPIPPKQQKKLKEREG